MNKFTVQILTHWKGYPDHLFVTHTAEDVTNPTFLESGQVLRYVTGEGKTVRIRPSMHDRVVVTEK